MRPIAFLTSRCMVGGGPDRRADHWEHELEFEPMAAACARLGLELRAVVWDREDLDPRDFEAMVVGTTWDYAEQVQAFLSRLESFARVVPLFNPVDVLRWNLDKGYLADLGQRGAPIVPTLWRERADAGTLGAAFDELQCDELVVKPRVGACAWRQARVRRGESLPGAEELPPGAALLQPFLPAVATEGEYSFVFFGPEFSHCAQKLPAAGDYRVQSIFGARERVHLPSPEELALARAVLAAATDEPLLQARVDMVRGPEGGLLLMELELVEPYLYPEQGPRMGEVFARALRARLDGPPSG
ncbi:ATP-grasp domain-containing protein [Engelhardtia mirabilis]|uniref:Cycloserine biosynthesis protein DcsG n=1 Tax=Engelhardtia mirabilis TaxID=2528011 RepID=A0A518BMA4_9BACT|nr:Cycloserine biosynthesis protein DcsG [Planctomycetes bacterium Pla133]QDV02438.1 Cycloserine biosynthesis protein DcsG [Planctomycetes bacterium Pla86]